MHILTSIHPSSLLLPRDANPTTHRACEQSGFFVITSHGVPQQVIDEAWKASRDFFDLPIEQKEDESIKMMMG